MIKNIFLFLSLSVFFTTTILAQQTTNTVSQNKMASDKLDKEVYGFLQEVEKDIDQLKAVENKILFSANIAFFMNKYDVNKSKQMFQKVETDFLTLYAKHKILIDKTIKEEEEEEEFYYKGFPLTERRDFSIIRTLAEIRGAIIMLMAQNDAFGAYEFAKKTNEERSLAGYHWSGGNRNELFSNMPIQDMDKSIRLGKKLLENKFDRDVLVLAKSVYKVDEEKGAEFGKEVINKVISEYEMIDSGNILHILEKGKENLEAVKKKKNEKPLFERKSLAKLSELFTKKLLKQKEFDEYEMSEYLSLIGIFSPKSAEKLKAKLKDEEEDKSNTVSDKGKVVIGKERVDVTSVIKGDVKDKVKEAAKRILEEIGVEDEKPTAKEKTRRDRKKKQKQFAKDLMGFSSKKLSKQERLNFIKNARKVISTVKNPSQKLWLLTELAFQLGFQEEDRKIALELSNEASLLTTNNPTTIYDFWASWRLVNGYAGVDNEKAFSILEDVVLKLNEPISGVSKIFKFIGFLDGIIYKDEIILGEMANVFVRDIATSELSYFDVTMLRLAQADFKRLKALGNKFERPEVRVMAKILILQNLVMKKNKHSVR